MNRILTQLSKALSLSISINLLVSLLSLRSNSISIKKITRAASSVPTFTSCTVPNSFALTFDDGPGSLCNELDEALNQLNIQATFFLNGKNFGCIYDHAECLKRSNHGWDHNHMNQLNAQEMHLQLSKVEDAMIKILGVKPLYFRPPYGEYNDLLLQVLGERGYKGLILWTNDSGDSMAVPPSPQEIIELYKTFKVQSNILNHETKDFTIKQVVPSIVPALKSKGYHFIPVEYIHIYIYIILSKQKFF
ncbi:hypothetical protein PPACK8108_LOCUS20299 [Phakopsora pachyrhizi]|uniref:NodB homology domain-containing protein n=1 Tax=Phakopsora pachyrhizi TaxID=170000 RepID=A0AAV0BEP6_PHAPC|nr:hypothetical protein PPACK8108_LOCUS20299 [Phakopsora pachyrhizi]